VLIEVFDQNEGLHGDHEVWVKVLSNTVADWPEVKKRLTDAQEAVMKGTSSLPFKYYVHMVTPEEKAEHGYSFEDWWIFKQIAPGVRSSL
jgi:hypothetical protein